MGWFLRKSVRIGPVRFNLSKSGIGTSVGVKGFRIGVRPNGKSYIHAGRQGLYYRQELGESTPKDDLRQEPSEFIVSDQNTTKYETASSKDLISHSRKYLLEKLNNSYKAPRLDLIVGAIFLILTFFLFSYSDILGAISTLIGIVGFILIARWETKRRTISLIYDFEDKKGERFDKLITAFNNLASNNSVWALIDSRYIGDMHESKLNAGAANLVNKSTAQIGEGKPPWVETNINVPVIKARKQTLYMMPDGILVYDSSGVGHVEYNELDVQADTTRFIEESIKMV